MQNEKQKLRRAVLEKRNTLDSHYVQVANDKIMRQLLALKQYQDSHTLFTFISKAGEIDTKPLIDHAQKQGKMVGVPRVYPQHQMKVHQFTDWKALELSNMKILEPYAHAEIVDSATIDLIILPCVSCNTAGERLGYGGGFYDRFLADARVTATTVLPCLAALQTEDIPTEVSDRKADIVIDENGTYFI